MNKALGPAEVKNKLLETQGWQLNQKGEIQKEFHLKDFSHALLFASAIGQIAETLDHHPDILIRWDKVMLSVSTHSAGGLTALDFALAKRADSLISK